jgi:hypothetical protein
VSDTAGPRALSVSASQPWVPITTTPDGGQYQLQVTCQQPDEYSQDEQIEEEGGGCFQLGSYLIGICTAYFTSDSRQRLFATFQTLS